MHPRPTPMMTGAAALAAATVLATPVSADVNGNWISPSEFSVWLTHMPDFDQIRESAFAMPGLPNDGMSYCAPTCVLNLSAYVALHGHPTSFPGAEDWQSQTHYETATFALQQLGVIGNTDPFLGTTHAGILAQAQFSLPIDRFTVTVDTFGTLPTAGIPDFARWVRDGSLVSFFHGWYNWIGEINGVPVLEATTAHCLTFRGANASVFDALLFAGDPADDAEGFSQSTFSTRIYDWSSPVVIANGVPRSANRIKPANQDEAVWRLIDGYCKVTPKMGVSLTDFNALTVQVADGPADSPATLIEVLPPENRVLEAATFGPANDRLYVILRGATGQFFPACRALHDLDWREFLDIPLPGPSDMFFGDDRSMYTIGGGEISRILFDVPDGAEPKLIGSREVGQRAVADFDSDTDRVVLFDPAVPLLRMLPPDLNGDPVNFEMALGALEGDVRMAWDATRTCAWATKPGSETFLQIIPSAAGGIAQVAFHVLPDGMLPVDIDVDDQGHLFVSDGGKWYEFAQDSNGDWKAQEGSFIHGQPIGTRPVVSRSRTNWDPDVHSLRQQQHVPPTSFGVELLDCPADLDADRAVGFADLLALLATWGPCPTGEFCDADLDFDGTVNFADLLALLAAFGDCP
ncbi:MAG: hypothetical protein AB8G96_05760 [Phycisphaerales bacterium]